MTAIFHELEKKIETIYTQTSFNEDDKKIIFEVLSLLDTGKIRVCSSTDGHWQTHQWIKKSILLYFKIQNSFKLLLNFRSCVKDHKNLCLMI